MSKLIITHEQLVKKRACYSGLLRKHNAWGDGPVIIDDTFIEKAAKFLVPSDVAWLALTFMPRDWWFIFVEAIDPYIEESYNTWKRICAAVFVAIYTEYHKP